MNKVCLMFFDAKTYNRGASTFSVWVGLFGLLVEILKMVIFLEHKTNHLH